MEDETDGEDEFETFSLDLTASQMYSLNMILHYNAIDISDVGFSRTAESIGREVSRVMNSEEFTEAMDEEVESFMENNSSQLTKGDVHKTNVPGMGGGVQ